MGLCFGWFRANLYLHAQKLFSELIYRGITFLLMYKLEEINKLYKLSIFLIPSKRLNFIEILRLKNPAHSIILDNRFHTSTMTILLISLPRDRIFFI